jgi:hypothetical protein
LDRQYIRNSPDRSNGDRCQHGDDLASTSDTSNCVAIDDQFVYWGENGSADGGVATLRDAPKGGGEVRILATGIAPTGRHLVDESDEALP